MRRGDLGMFLAVDEVDVEEYSNEIEIQVAI